MSKESQKYHILLVEDSILANTAAKMLLQMLGVQVTAVFTGQQALDIYRNCDGILLDIGLPDISGLDVCQKIRAQEGAAHIPIIALTAHSDEKTMEDCLASGFDIFIVKPLTESVAKRAIKEYFRKQGNNNSKTHSKNGA